MSEALKRYKEIIAECNNLSHAQNTIYWDMETIMPKEGFKGHSDSLTYLSTEVFKKTTSDEFYELLKTLNTKEEFEKLSDIDKYCVKEDLKDIERDRRVPADFFESFVRAQNEAGVAWQDAKKANDFSIFAPHLKTMIDMTKQMVKYQYPDKDPYDALLDQYEEGMTREAYDKVFNELKEGLVPLIKKITACNKKENPKFNDTFSIPAEKETEKLLLNYIGFSFDKGTTGETEHPFTMEFSSKDVRVSNHFREDDVTDPMFSAIHEGGHAIFEQNVDEILDGTTAGSCKYLGLHESQSRFYENILGRNKSFWVPIYEKIQEIEPKLKAVSLDEFYEKINFVKNSFIRTAADEVTYCLHIIVRYEIEKEIFLNNVDVDSLPKLWNEKMQEYLGITPSCPAEGILQDMHWSDGSFGYFPTYLLGTIYDGMYLEKITEELGDIDVILKEGRILEITKWLNEKIHKYGSMRKPKEVIKAVCGKEVSAQPILKYFTEKYSKLYNI